MADPGPRSGLLTVVLGRSKHVDIFLNYRLQMALQLAFHLKKKH